MANDNIILENPASEERISDLHEKLASSGQALRNHEFETFTLHVSAPDNSLTAGLKGEIIFKSAHISELWVDESRRGQGLASRLLQRAESHARARGCIRMHLETRNKKARALYERLGYVVFGVLENYEGENAFCYLEKKLN
ncbi:MAG: GNAT family N-acetyltransferase [Pseudomonadota bacterium]